MIAELGTFAFALALALSIAQAGLSIAARVKASAPLRGAGEGAAVGAFLAILLAFACLVTVFIRSDFSVLNVAQHSHTAKPLLYKIAGSWGSHEGSMALWCLALTAFGAVVAVTGRNLPWKLKTLARPHPPALRPPRSEPIASAASSINASPCACAQAAMAGMSGMPPYRSTANTALVREVRQRSSVATLTHQVSASTSANTGVAPR